MADRILVTSPSMPPFEEYQEEIRDLWESKWLTNMGVKHQRFEEELRRYLDADRAVLLINGHMALELALQAMDLRGEVITTPFTFVSTTHAIIRSGLEPVFCDIEPETFTIDADQIEKKITDRTCAILPVHVYGNICNMEKIDWIAKKYGLKVIYDAAHAFGEKYKGKGMGRFGDASCFSFHATKVFNTIEGGAVCTSDLELAAMVTDLKNFGIKGYERISAVGTNAKMNEFSAAMGICNLRHIEKEIDKRRVAVQRYRERLTGIKGIRITWEQDGVKSNFSYFPILIDEKKFGATRNDVCEFLSKNEVFARKYFYPLTSMCECFRGKYNAEATPQAVYVSQRVLTLPLYADLSVEIVDRICDLVLSCRGKNEHL